MSNIESEPVDVVEPISPALEEEAAAVTNGERPRHLKSVFREYFESIVVTLVMALFGMTFITQAVKVPTGSMLNTILVEDHLMVNKFQLAPHPGWLEGILPYRDIRRGDVIVFKYPKNPEENYVKRVIGLPGDTILVRGTRVFVNGKELPEKKIFVGPQRDNEADLQPISDVETAEGASWTVYYSEATRFEDSLGPDDGEQTETLDELDAEEPADEIDEEEPGVGRGSPHFDIARFAIGKPFKIPAGQYFCLGDNRDNSQDSRYWGTVPRENVVGRAMFVYWSIDESARSHDPEPGNLLTDILRYSRWGRTFTAIR
jgi:signal peptidase I